MAGATLRQLAKLINKSFLAADPESGRYTVHELLRQYGVAALQGDGGRYGAIQQAHALYYAGLAEGAYEDIQNGRQPQALAGLEADIDNIRVAWRRLVSAGDPAAAARMVRPLWFLYEVQGWYVAGAELFALGSKAPSGPAPGRGPETEALRTLAGLCGSAQSWFVSNLGEVETGQTLGQLSLSALRQVGNPNDLQFAFNMLNVGL